VLLGEVDTSGDNISDFYGEPDKPILHLPLNYRLIDLKWKAPHVACAIEEYLGRLPDGGWGDWVIGSHDKKRIASTVGLGQARVMALLAFTLPGTPAFYAGDELGMKKVPIASADALDPFERLNPGYGLNRDPERTPMQWDASANAGFTKGKPWLRVADDYRTCNVEVQRADERSMLHFYRRLIALRHSNEALNIGAYRSVPPQGDVIAFTRSEEKRRLLVALNLSERAQSFELPHKARGRVIFSTSLEREGERADARVELRGDEALILQLE
jgi:alpha-glucosidase